MGKIDLNFTSGYSFFRLTGRIFTVTSNTVDPITGIIKILILEQNFSHWHNTKMVNGYG